MTDISPEDSNTAFKLFAGGGLLFILGWFFGYIYGYTTPSVLAPPKKKDGQCGCKGVG